MPTSYFVIIFLACCFVSVFYWQIVQPVLLRGIRFRLFARRDELRRLAIDCEEDHLLFSYRETESFICKTLAVVPSLSLMSFIRFLMASCNDPEIDKNLERMRAEASPALLGMMSKTAQDGLMIMYFNSPIITFSCGVIALCLWIVGKFNSMLLYRKAETFIDELPNNGVDDFGRLAA